MPGAENLSGRGQDGNTHLRIASKLVKAGDQLLHQLERERVAALWPVEHDDRGLVFVAHAEMPVFHDADSCSHYRPAELGLDRARSSFLRILPVAVRGSGPNSTYLGHLKCARRVRANSMSSSAVADCPGLSPT